MRLPAPLLLSLLEGPFQTAVHREGIASHRNDSRGESDQRLVKGYSGALRMFPKDTVQELPTNKMSRRRRHS